MMDGMPYRKFDITLNPGDVIYLYTDGVPEAHNIEDELFGDERLLNCLNANRNISMKDLCHTVAEELKAYTGEAEQFDDITMLALKMNERQYSMNRSTTIREITV